MQGNLLKGEIIAKGMTMGKVAKESMISRNSFSAKVSGRRQFTADEIARVCNVLGITDPAKKTSIFLD